MHDTHVHPCNLLERDPAAEETRRRLGITAAASAWNRGEFDLHRNMARAAPGGVPLLLCFAVHPQAVSEHAWSRNGFSGKHVIQDSLEALAEYAAAGELAAVGECGFDLYNELYRAAEPKQERLFAVHLETARQYGLPLVLHVRRAMHKIFSYTKELKKCSAVVFHSWPGSVDDGFSLLRRGVNVFFSFGTAIMLNHKHAIASCAAFPKDRLLFETDAPWQPLRGKAFSSWDDLSAVVQNAAAIRTISVAELERTSDANFYRVFAPDRRTASEQTPHYQAPPA